MTIEVGSHRNPTIRDPRNAEMGYRAEYEFTLESIYAPWMVEVPVGAAHGEYRVTMVVEYVSREERRDA